MGLGLANWEHGCPIMYNKFDENCVNETYLLVKKNNTDV